jgi:hypothetical protein
MAVQTVYIPLSFKFDPYEARFNDEYRKAKSETAVSKREEAQADLNALLAQGYTVVTQTNIESRSGIDLAIILYKPDDEPSFMTPYDQNLLCAGFESARIALEALNEGDTEKVKRVLLNMDVPLAKLALSYGGVKPGCDAHVRMTDYIAKRQVEREAKKANEVKS